MKKLRLTVILAIVVAMVLGMSACGSSDEAKNEEQSDTETGAWTISDQKAETVLPNDVNRAFDKAIKDYKEGELAPVAYVGSQVVAGMNYMILCRATDKEKKETSYQMVVIYADIDGNAELTSHKDFDFSKYTDKEGVKEQENLSGGWTAAAEATGTEIPKDVKKAYEKATATIDWKWSSVKPLTYLGSQVVAGTNYAILCKGEISSEKEADSILVITVYEDLDGNAEVTNTCTLDLSEFTEQ